VTHGDLDDNAVKSAHLFQDCMHCYLSCIALDWRTMTNAPVQWDDDTIESITGHEINPESKHEQQTYADTPAPPFYCDLVPQAMSLPVAPTSWSSRRFPT